ncbi:MAG TPA: hypothetical protein VMS30_06575 [Phycisphaerales bacterium]|nr:hypothetical protein [Phycisphaerales bacterium]
MACHDRKPSQLTPRSRAFLERFLKEVRRVNLVGGMELVALIERTLAGAPIIELDDEPGCESASPPHERDGEIHTGHQP